QSEYFGSGLMYASTVPGVKITTADGNIVVSQPGGIPTGAIPDYLKPQPYGKDPLQNLVIGAENFLRGIVVAPIAMDVLAQQALGASKYYKQLATTQPVYNVLGLASAIGGVGAETFAYAENVFTGSLPYKMGGVETVV